jgi:hypothetical protein
MCSLADAQLGKDRQEVERRVQSRLKLPSETAGQVRGCGLAVESDVDLGTQAGEWQK